jgi:hypothetical protein
MTDADVERFACQDEMKALILGIVFGAIGLTIVLSIVFFPLAGYQIWKYFKIKEAKRIVEYRKNQNSISNTPSPQNNTP